MFVGVCRLELLVPASTSLKDKRAVVRSTLSRLRSEFQLAAAEIEAQDRRGRAVIGLAVVSNRSEHAREVIEAAARFAEDMRPDAEFITVETDVLSAF